MPDLMEMRIKRIEEMGIRGKDVDWYRKYIDPIFDGQLSLYDNAINKAYHRKHYSDVEMLMRERESLIKTYLEAYSKEINEAILKFRPE